MEHVKKSYYYHYPKGHFQHVPKAHFPTTTTQVPTTTEISTTTTTATTTTEAFNVTVVEAVQNTVESLKTTLKQVFETSTEAVTSSVVNDGASNTTRVIDLMENVSTNVLNGSDLDEMVTSNNTLLETNSTFSVMAETTTTAMSNIQKGIDWLGSAETTESILTNTNDTILNSYDNYHDNDYYLPIYIILGVILGIMCIICIILGITYYTYRKNRLNNHGECNFGATYSQSIQIKDC